MKFLFGQKVIIPFLTLLVIILLFAQCKQRQTGTVKGYEGTITNASSQALLATNHFISKDSIAVFTKRYQHFKDSVGLVTQPNPHDVLTDSTSFNSAIVRAILTDPNCIGLRVLYGLGADGKLHVILVGINPDYSTLYIQQPDGEGAKGVSNLGQANGYQYKQVGSTKPVGGAEYGK